jgi:hypothetical protein
MTDPTPLGNVIIFLQKIGIYDVVLPFLLVFTLVFAIFERTRVLGTEKADGQDIPRKNLNAIAAFAIAFIVIASSKLVETITAVSSQMVVVLMLMVFFMVLVGIFVEEGGATKIVEGKARITFLIIAAIAITALFLNALKTPDGNTWLEIGFWWISQFWSSTAVAAVILMIGVVIFVWFMTQSKTTTGGGHP